jgi:hypothetical protein
VSIAPDTSQQADQQANTGAGVDQAGSDVVTPATPVRHTLSPTYEVAFPGADYIWAVDFSPDGRTAYCSVDGQSIDLWAAGLSNWPAILGGCLGLVSLVYVLIVGRVRRRHQVKGDPHCRRCNYHLIAHAPLSVAPRAQRVPPTPGTLCPECGVDLARRRPRKGRGNLRRLWLPTAILLACVAAYAGLFVAGVPRAASSPDAPWLGSTLVDRWADRWQLDGLLAHRAPVTRVMTLDTRTGAVTGCLRTARGFQGFGLLVSPDGGNLAIAETGRVVWIDARTGRAAAATSAGQFETGIADAVFIAGFWGDAADPWVYFSDLDPRAFRSRFWRWRPRTGEKMVVLDEPAYTFTATNGATRGVARRYGLLHRPDGLAMFSASDFMEAYQEKKYAITVRGPMKADGSAGDAEREILAPDSACITPPALTSDAALLFVDDVANGVRRYDVRTGEELGVIKPASPEIPRSKNLAISADNRLLFIPIHKAGILVRDLDKQDWPARLVYPAPFVAPRLWLSRDGRWLAATPVKSVGSGNAARFVRELFLFDLSEAQAR